MTSVVINKALKEKDCPFENMYFHIVFLLFESLCNWFSSFLAGKTEHVAQAKVALVVNHSSVGIPKALC